MPDSIRRAKPMKGDIELPNPTGRIDPRLKAAKTERKLSLNPLKNLTQRIQMVRRRSR